MTGPRFSARLLNIPRENDGRETTLSSIAVPNANIIMGGAPPERQGIASGIVATARDLGMVFGVAVTGAILALQMAQRTASQANPQAAFIGAFQDTLFIMTFVGLIGASAAMVRQPARAGAIAH